METRASDYDFGPMHEAVQKYLDDDYPRDGVVGDPRGR